MKRLLLAVAAVTAIAAPAAALADSYRGDGGYYDGRYDGGRYDERDYGGRYDRGDYGRGDYYGDRYGRDGYAHAREWRRGERLPPRFRGEWVNWRRAGLRPPVDRNHAWFRVGGQFVMANVDNGLIAVAIWRR